MGTALMQTDNLPHNRQPEAMPFLAVALLIIDLSKRLKHALGLLGRNALAIIFHHQLIGLQIVFERDMDIALRESGRIAQ